MWLKEAAGVTSPVSSGLWLYCQQPTLTAKAALNQLACAQCPQAAAPPLQMAPEGTAPVGSDGWCFPARPQKFRVIVPEAASEMQPQCPVISPWSQQQPHRAQPTLRPCLDMFGCLFEQTQICLHFMSPNTKSTRRWSGLSRLHVFPNKWFAINSLS